MPDMRAADAAVTVRGVRAEVLAYVAGQLDYLDEVAARTNTPRPSQERLPRERLEHLEGLVRCIRLGVQAEPERVPSPHYLRALAAQACAWLESERELRRVSW